MDGNSIGPEGRSKLNVQRVVRLPNGKLVAMLHDGDWIKCVTAEGEGRHFRATHRGVADFRAEDWGTYTLMGTEGHRKDGYNWIPPESGIIDVEGEEDEVASLVSTLPVSFVRVLVARGAIDRTTHKRIKTVPMPDAEVPHTLTSVQIRMLWKNQVIFLY